MAGLRVGLDLPRSVRAEVKRLWKESAPGDEVMALAELGDMVLERTEELLQSLVRDRRSHKERLHALAPLRRMALALLDVEADDKRRRLILFEAIEIASAGLKNAAKDRPPFGAPDGSDLAAAVVDLRRCVAMFYPEAAAKLDCEASLAAVLAWDTRNGRWEPVAVLAAAIGAGAAVETLQQDWSRHRRGERFFRRLPCWSD